MWILVPVQGRPTRAGPVRGIFVKFGFRVGWELNPPSRMPGEASEHRGSAAGPRRADDFDGVHSTVKLSAIWNTSDGRSGCAMGMVSRALDGVQPGEDLSPRNGGTVLRCGCGSIRGLGIGHPVFGHPEARDRVWGGSSSVAEYPTESMRRWPRDGARSG